MRKSITMYLNYLALVLFPIAILGNDAVKWIFETGRKVIATPVIRNDTLFIGAWMATFIQLTMQTDQNFGVMPRVMKSGQRQLYTGI